MYYYSLFGYVIESDLEFLYLLKAEKQEADISICAGEIPEKILEKENAGKYEFGETVSWLVNTTCYLYVTNGNRIIYKLKEGGRETHLCTYIMGWGMSMLGLQRGINAMHCSVVARDEGAILISGESGAGKSTLTNVLLESNWKFMADDMAFTEVKEDGQVMIKPAFPYQKLCRDAAMRKGYPLEELIYIDEDKDKFFVPYKGEFISHEMPVKALVVLTLSDKEEVAVTELEGFNKYLACANNLFLRKLLKKDRYTSTAGRESFRMAQGIRVFVIERPTEGDTLDEITGKALEIAESVL